MLLINKLKEKNPDNTFVKLWENKRTHALICLILWIVFLLLILFILSFSNKNTQKNIPSNEIKNDIITISNMKNKLLNYNFEYKYTILIIALKEFITIVGIPEKNVFSISTNLNL